MKNFALDSRIFPEIEEFKENFVQNKSQILWTRLVADLDTPVSALLKLQQAGQNCFLLESVEGGETRGRYSIIGLLPDAVWKCQDNIAQICTDVEQGNFKSAGDAFTSLRELLASSRLEIPENLPPMSAGWVGYLGYDMIRLVENVPKRNPDPINIPDAQLMRPSVTVVFDGRDGVITIAAPVWMDKNYTNADAAYSEAESRIEEVLIRLARPVANAQRFQATEVEMPEFTPQMTREDYYAMVEKAKEYIRAGDIFQMVPSQRFSAEFKLPPVALYRALRFLNPSPFLFYLQLDGFSLVGSSPEILVRVRDEEITIRPIAGTRKRGATHEEDLALEQELLNDPKELSEHLMLLDLGRNDVGRCAQTGTVTVTEQMIVERYSHVMHIVSNVVGKLDPKYDCLDALMSGFPAGTVSGAPKIRAMEIIDELEPIGRSFYAGCVGYFSANGSMDTCITLRTGLIKDDILYVQAGGGVVADSDREAEYQETLNKAQAIMRAAGYAAQFSGK